MQLHRGTTTGTKGQRSRADAPLLELCVQRAHQLPVHLIEQHKNAGAHALALGKELCVLLEVRRAQLGNDGAQQHLAVRPGRQLQRQLLVVGKQQVQAASELGSDAHFLLSAGASGGNGLAVVAEAEGLALLLCCG